MRGPVLLAVILLVVGKGLFYVGWTRQSAALGVAVKK